MLIAAIIYTLSIFSEIVVDLAQDISNRGSALVAAFYAPLLFCLLFSFLLLYYRAILHKGLYKNHLDRLNIMENGLLAIKGLLAEANSFTNYLAKEVCFRSSHKVGFIISTEDRIDAK